MATMPAVSSLVMLGEPFKLDHFIAKRFFRYGSVYLENDPFQGIKLRASTSSGPGYHELRQSAAHRQGKTDNLYLLTLGYAFDTTLNDRSCVGSY